jgi:hypothetical protein
MNEPVAGVDMNGRSFKMVFGRVAIRMYIVGTSGGQSDVLVDCRVLWLIPLTNVSNDGGGGGQMRCFCCWSSSESNIYGCIRS